MGGAVDAIGDAVGGAFDFVGDTVESFGDVVDDAFDAVGDVLGDVAGAVVDGVEAIGDVLGDVADFAQVLVERYAIQVALMAVGIPPYVAAPMSAGMHTLAKGGSPEDALKASATFVVVDAVGNYVQAEMQIANADAIAQGGQAVYSAGEISAATSAAQSAVATAAVGGDINDVLKGAAIGAVAGVSATEVYKQTNSLAAANATRVATQAALSGAKIEQAILMGASSAMVTYLQDMEGERQRIQNLTDIRDDTIEAYKRRAESYNKNAARYNNLLRQGDPYPDLDSNITSGAEYSANQQYKNEMASLRGRLTKELPIIQALADDVGRYNQAIKDQVDIYMQYQAKAEAEAKKLEVQFEKTTREQLETEQQQREALAQELSNMIAETEGRRYEGIEVAGDLPVGVEESFRSLPLIGESVVNESEAPDAIRRTVVGTTPQGEEYSYNIVIDKTDGSVFYETFGGEDGFSSVTTAFDERPTFNQVGGQGTANIGEILATRPTLTETEIDAINQIARETRGKTIRSSVEQELFEKELERFEADLQAAENQAKQEAARADFVTKQRERLAQSNRLSGSLQAQIDAELESILDEYEQTKGRATAAAAERERVVASQQGRQGTVSDEEVMRLLGLSPEEGERYGLTTGGGGAGFVGLPEGAEEGEGGLGEGGKGLGGEGEGEGLGDEAEVEEPTEQRFDLQGRPIIATATVRPQPDARERGTPGIPSRVTGEALVGILGEKEPLFGGDEDEQRAVWNRRSLRLRKALGL